METNHWTGGGIPVGYKYNLSLKSLELDSKFAGVVKTIFSLALNKNLSAMEIAEYLNRKKIKSKRNKEWSYKTISYLFTPHKILFYSGHRSNQEGNWPALISKDTAAKLISKNVVSIIGSRPRVNTYLLPGLGIACCGYCGGPIKSAYTKRENKISFYYVCSKKQMRGVQACPNSKVIHQNKVDDAIIDNLKRQANNLINIKKYSLQLLTKNKPGVQKSLRILDKQVSVILDKQSNSVSNNEIETLSNQITELMNNRKKLIKDSIIDFDYDSFSKDEIKNFNRLSIITKRTLLPKYFTKIVLKFDKIVLEYPFPVMPNLSKKIEVQI